MRCPRWKLVVVETNCAFPQSRTKKLSRFRAAESLGAAEGDVLNCHMSILAEICEKRKLYFHLFALAIAPSKVAKTADLVKEIGGEHLTVKPIMALTSESTSAGDD